MKQSYEKNDCRYTDFVNMCGKLFSEICRKVLAVYISRRHHDNHHLTKSGIALTVSGIHKKQSLQKKLRKKTAPMKRSNNDLS